MTVPYTQSVATARIGGFFRLLFRWRGSIYQVIYGETIIFIVLYYALNLSYRGLMSNTKWQKGFETFTNYCKQFSDFIPVTFVLGFYVIHACSRRWTQWESIPWPDKFGFQVSGDLIGADQKTLMLRRTLMRYINLASVLCFRDLSIAVRKRFPTLQHLTEAGLMSESELQQFKKNSSSKDSNWWIPFHWAYNLIYRIRIEGMMSEGSAKQLQDVATLSVYLFMLASLFGRQQLKPDDKDGVDLLVPVFPFLQVMFYLGWLKVGEVLSNPFGGDADDFEMNYIIDRNLRMSYALVDEHYNLVPPIEKDAFWNVEPRVPHTAESAGLRTEGYIGSAVSLDKPDRIISRSTADPVGRMNSSRSRTRTLSRPLSRLLSRTSYRDQAARMKLLEAVEKGEITLEELPSTPDSYQSNRIPTNINVSSQALPSIMEMFENPHYPEFLTGDDKISLLTDTSHESKFVSALTTPMTDEARPVTEEDQARRSNSESVIQTRISSRRISA